jgi:hypothetical protein
LKDALAVGFAQVLSLVPGASRSGSTIMGGLFAGERRETAARFSFLLSIPAIAASGLLELKEALHSLPAGSGAPLAVATVVSWARRLRVHLVPAALPAHALDGRLHRLPPRRRRAHSRAALHRSRSTRSAPQCRPDLGSRRARVRLNLYAPLPSQSVNS